MSQPREVAEAILKAMDTARAAALEEAARVADAQAERSGRSYADTPKDHILTREHYQARLHICREVAALIRALAAPERTGCPTCGNAKPGTVGAVGGSADNPHGTPCPECDERAEQPATGAAEGGAQGVDLSEPSGTEQAVNFLWNAAERVYQKYGADRDWTEWRDLREALDALRSRQPGSAEGEASAEPSAEEVEAAAERIAFHKSWGADPWLARDEVSKEHWRAIARAALRAARSAQRERGT